MSKLAKNNLSIFQNLPSFVWVLIFVGGIIAFIGGIIFFFFLLATVPGVASIVMLIAGGAVVWGGGSVAPIEDKKAEGFFMAIGITFFALMGMAIDQSGNYLYNYPLRYLCPEGSYLNRGVDVSHPLPGRTDITQDYACYSSDGERVSNIDMGYVIAVRFFEYVCIAYLLIWGSRGLKKIRHRREPHASTH